MYLRHVDPLARQNYPVLGLAQQHLSKLSSLALDVEIPCVIYS